MMSEEDRSNHPFSDENRADTLYTLAQERPLTPNEVAWLRARDSYHHALATTDALTGLPNRRASDRMLEQLVEDSSITQGFCYVLFDVDRFKTFNDTYGHDAGDSVLKALSSTVQESLRDTDSIAPLVRDAQAYRYGGEEFVVLLRGADLPNGVAIADTRLRRIVQEQLSDLYPDPVTISCGVAHYDGTQSLHDLVTAADTALYASKEAGRNAVSYCEKETGRIVTLPR